MKGGMFDIMSVTQKKLLCVCVFYLFMADHCITISLSEGKKKIPAICENKKKQCPDNNRSSY